MQQIDIIKAPVAEYVADFHSQFDEILATKSEWPVSTLLSYWS